MATQSQHQPRRPILSVGKRTVLTYANRPERIHGFMPEEPFYGVDVDVIVCMVASKGYIRENGGDGPHYLCPERDPLYAINGRPC